jgi:hypothetical protein
VSGPLTPDRERGASAVEFALVMPILVLFLFGIIQYGYGLFQLQSFNAALGDASRLAATGITSCSAFDNTLKGLLENNGLDKDDLVGVVHVQWQTDSGTPSGIAARLGYARVTATYRMFRIGVPGIPFPSQVTRSQTVVVQDIGALGLGNC